MQCAEIVPWGKTVLKSAPSSLVPAGVCCFHPFRRNQPLLFLIIQYEKQTPQHEIIYHCKHDNLIWVCQTFCFIIFHYNFARVVLCKVLWYALLSVSHLTAAGRNSSLTEKGKIFWKPVAVQSYSSHPGLLIWGFLVHQDWMKFLRGDTTGESGKNFTMILPLLIT